MAKKAVTKAPKTTKKEAKPKNPIKKRASKADKKDKAPKHDKKKKEVPKLGKRTSRSEDKEEEKVSEPPFKRTRSKVTADGEMEESKGFGSLGKTLDLCLICDATGSMASWI